MKSWEQNLRTIVGIATAGEKENAERCESGEFGKAVTNLAEEIRALEGVIDTLDRRYGHSVNGQKHEPGYWARLAREGKLAVTPVGDGVNILRAVLWLTAGLSVGTLIGILLMQRTLLPALKETTALLIRYKKAYGILFDVVNNYTHFAYDAFELVALPALVESMDVVAGRHGPLDKLPEENGV